MPSEKRSLQSIASDYFRYLGKSLPQQCASDEFYFLPRSEAAIQFLGILDNLHPEKIQDHVTYVRNLLGEVSRVKSDGLEAETDRLLLKQSMKSFLREFDEVKVWRIDPTLYIKIPLFAIDRILSEANSASEKVESDLWAVFCQIPSFLKHAPHNLQSPSEISLKVAINMTQDVIHYHRHDIPTFIGEKLGQNQKLLTKNKDLLETWQTFKKGLQKLPARGAFAVGKQHLQKILSVNLGYPKTLAGILETSQTAFNLNLEKLDRLARKIDRHKTWNEIIYEKRPGVSSPEDILSKYRREVEKLRRFFYSQDVMTLPAEERLTVCRTPAFLQSLRAAAAYRAPLTGAARDQGTFYITPGKEDLTLISRHRPYLCAHESYPGHHILDHLRIHHSNPIRRQIESPLFYEGWACYAEQLLDELGYIRNPRLKLIGLKRRLWRNLRAELDIKLQTGKLTLDQAAQKVESLGFSGQRARRQVRRFALTPGYQLCYFMGNHEIAGLREHFSSQLGMKAFHDSVLGGGQLPFHLVEKRLEAGVQQKR